MPKQKIIQARSSQGLVFYTGYPIDNSALHSEPKHDQPRMFISIMPGDKLNITEYQNRRIKK